MTDMRELLLRARVARWGVKPWDPADPMQGGRRWCVVTGWGREAGDAALSASGPVLGDAAFLRLAGVRPAFRSQGPGAPYVEPPRIRRTRTRVLVTQRFGWDI